MAAMLLRKSGVSLRAAAPVSRRTALVVRATGETPADKAPAAAEAPVAEGNVSGVSVAPAQPAMAAAAAAPAAVKAASLTDVFTFSNPTGPETMNGRLAMIGVLAAIGAELASGESFIQQFEAFTPVVLATWVIIAAASAIPLMKGASTTEAFGPLTHTAEMANGRAAMLGLAALIIIELTKGSALF